MSTKWRRYEVLLPRRLNDGSDVPAELISKAVLEIRDQFGAVSHETQIIEGHWQEGGVIYRDDLARVYKVACRAAVRASSCQPIQKLKQKYAPKDK